MTIFKNRTDQIILLIAASTLYTLSSISEQPLQAQNIRWLAKWDSLTQETKTSSDTLIIEVVTSDDEPLFSEFPFGKTTDFSNVARRFPHASLKSRTVYWGGGDKYATYQLSSGKNYIKFYKDESGSDEASPYYDVYYGQISDNGFAMPGGIKVGMSQVSFLSRYFEKLSIQLFAHINVVEIHVEPCGQTRKLIFAAGKLRVIYFSTENPNSDDSTEY